MKPRHSEQSPSPPAWHWAAALAAFALHLWLGWGFIRESAPTFDEAVHLASGYTDLAARRIYLNAMDHPPLAEIWAAVPLLALAPGAHLTHPDYRAGRVYNFSDFFLYKNLVPAERMLNAARFWCLATWGLLFLTIAVAWAARLEGPVAGAGAAFFFAFCPPLLSNAALVTTDAAAAALFFACFWILSGPRAWRHWLAAGAVMGLALAAKFSMIVLPPLAALMLLVESKASRAPDRFDPRTHWAGPLALGLAAAAALASVYGLDLALYARGLAATLKRLDEGRSSFLFGAHSTTGSLLYFPAALALKTPLPLLAAGGAFLLGWLKKPAADRFWLIGPPAAFFVSACLSKTQIGLRHILLVYPFLIVMGGAAAARAWRSGRSGRFGCALLGGWLAASALRSHPFELAYFNEAAGGPSQGWRYLVDSNLDWGQGLKTLARELARRGNPPVYLLYFGVADPSYYGLRYFPLGPPSFVDRREGVSEPGRDDPVLMAVSATNLQCTYYRDKRMFDWLKSRAPAFVAGHSLFLYDLTKDRDGAMRLAALLSSLGHAGAAARLKVKYSDAAPNKS